ncbi:MAG: class I SAM-dependent methyltransferase [Candidatus Obscuribacterales bacterium]|nr:class I SAM-dependent methyltransferase [Candidatus Obscuribacterales bacterium]
MPGLKVDSPLIFAASYTADFIASAISQKSAPVLDVGCGDGLIAQQVELRGYKVVAIDGSLKSIERARRNGVEAIHSKLEDFNHLPFDSIFMSRSLHHMPPLKQTLDKISELLAENGTFVIEDFGFDLADEAACAWLFEQTRRVIAAQSEPVHCEFHHEWLHEHIKSPEEAYGRWQKRYSVEHQLWSSKQMLSAVKERFVVRTQARVPYLFRFICDFLPATENGARRAREIFAQEQDLIDDGAIAAVGLRVVVARS